MEHPQTLANLWIVFQIIGIVFGIGVPAAFFWTFREFDIWRNLILLYLYFFRGLEHDPGRPAPADSWEELYYL